MGCVNHSVSGSGAVSEPFGGWGMGGVAIQPLRTGDSPLMTVVPCIYASPCLDLRTGDGLDVVQ
jgi:hypothetical protein